MTPQSSLRFIKLLHTVVWVFFVACIVLIPIFGFLRQFRNAAIVAGLVMVEILILALNRMSCPLTAVAASYTDDRADNFDIYLPLWLARYNKHIFGTLFLGGLLFTLARWLEWIR